MRLAGSHSGKKRRVRITETMRTERRTTVNSSDAAIKAHEDR